MEKMNISQGTLSERVREIITKNRRELSEVEGNILSLAAKDKDVRTIFVTSCNNSEGKTISAISLAYALYNETNLNVLLVDGNLQRPKLHELFNVEQSPGLSDFVLEGSVNVFRETEFERLMVMPAGTKISNTLDVFRATDFGEKMAMLRDKFDYVIVDSSSILGSSDTSVAAQKFDGVVFVLECEKTKWEVLQMAVDKVVKLRGHVLGVVMNKRKYYIPRFLYGKI
ncbi:MAG: CpsD/CapB family tyrosine-protein kinase [Nitrospirae bacterium]|nr:CpsD/CapB family tyrosine-protein kinase [Nitrospirota bacterium]